jgi:hypothetical protein
VSGPRSASAQKANAKPVIRRLDHSGELDSGYEGSQPQEIDVCVDAEGDGSGELPELLIWL